MKKREIKFIISSIVICGFAFGFLYSIIDGAQEVGDAPIQISSKWIAIKYTAIIFFFYFTIYYGIFWLINSFKKK